MEVSEARKRRLELAAKIAEMIREFEKETSLAVRGVDLRRAGAYATQSQLISVDVRVDLDA